MRSSIGADEARQRRVLVVGVLAGSGVALVLAALAVVGGQAANAVSDVVAAAILWLLTAALRVTGRWDDYVTAVALLLVAAPLGAALAEQDAIGSGALVVGVLGPVLASVYLSWTRTVAVTGSQLVGAALVLAVVGPSDRWTAASQAINGAIVTVSLVGVIGTLAHQRRAALAALAAEHDRSEALLLNVLPASIAVRLKDGARIADHFEEATVVFADVVGFTPLAASLPPGRLVDVLDDLFGRFDALTERHGLEKIKTIGDAYLAVGGLPIPRADHADAAASFALDLLDVVRAYRDASGLPLDVRVGIHTGPVVGGVIGQKKFAYDLWGDTVNVASRMESHGAPGRVQVTAAVRERLGGRFVLELRGPVEVRGRGPVETWWLVGRRDPA